MDIRTITRITEIVCAYTGEVIAPMTEFYERVNGDAVSIDYYESNEDRFLVCEECGRLIDTVYDDDYYETHDGSTICDNCRWAYYSRCDECGELYPDSELHYGLCDDCRRNRRILGYHEHDRDLMHFGLEGEITPIGFKGFGTEIEVENARFILSCQAMANVVAGIIGDDRAMYEEDASLRNGFEIITMPHTYEAYKKLEIKKALDKLSESGFTSHESGRCGLHVHASATWFGDDLETQRHNVAKLLYLYSEKFEFFRELSRREWDETEYCDKVSFSSTSQAYDQMFWSATGHYVAINVEHLRQSNDATVEFRLGRGTLNYDSHMAWVDICAALSRNAKDIEDDCLDLNKWLKGIELKTRGYILSRTGIVIDYSRRNTRRVVA